jgi:hypothetical protein
MALYFYSLLVIMSQLILYDIMSFDYVIWRRDVTFCLSILLILNSSNQSVHKRQKHRGSHQQGSSYLCLQATRVGAPGGLYANPYMIVSLEDYLLTGYTVKLTREKQCLVRRFFGAATCAPLSKQARVTPDKAPVQRGGRNSLYLARKSYF